MIIRISIIDRISSNKNNSSAFNRMSGNSSVWRMNGGKRQMTDSGGRIMSGSIGIAIRIRGVVYGKA